LINGSVIHGCGVGRQVIAKLGFSSLLNLSVTDHGEAPSSGCESSKALKQQEVLLHDCPSRSIGDRTHKPIEKQPPGHFIVGVMILATGVIFPVMAQANEVQYTCADNTVLNAVFSAQGASPAFARLRIAGMEAEIYLPQVISADGGRYANKDIEFWIKGNSARLTRKDASATTCYVR
jgi:membrane-bound inhibitor of C-type lysozyme